MKKIAVILIACICTGASAQNWLEQNATDPYSQYKDELPVYNDRNTYNTYRNQDRCVQAVNLDEGLGDNYMDWQNQCDNDLENCNCLNHGHVQGSLANEPIFRGNECIPVEVFEVKWQGGEKMWEEAGQQNYIYPSNWCDRKPADQVIKTTRGQEDGDDALWYRGEDWYKQQNTPQATPQQKCDDCLPY